MKKIYSALLGVMMILSTTIPMYNTVQAIELQQLTQEVNTNQRQDIAEDGSEPVWIEKRLAENNLVKVEITGTGTLDKEKFHNYLHNNISQDSWEGKPHSIVIKDKITFPEDSSDLFNPRFILFATQAEIIFEQGIDTSAVIDMSYMFMDCEKANPDVSEWDVSQVTNMDAMFSGCEKANPDVSEWDVSQVTNMEGMFSECEKANPDISKWRIAQKADMSEIFSNASSIKSVVLPNTIPKNVKFSHTSNDIPINLTAPDYIFKNNVNTTEQYPPKIKFKKGVYGFYNEEGILVDSFVGENLESAKEIVNKLKEGIYTLKTAPMNIAEDGSEPVWIEKRLAENNLVKVEITGTGTLDKEKFHNYLNNNIPKEEWLYKLSDDPDLPQTHMHAHTITIHDAMKLPKDSSYLFSPKNKDGLNSTPYLERAFIQLNRDIDTSNVTDMTAMFKESKISSPDVSKWQTSNVMSMKDMFYRSYSFNPDVSEWDVSNVKDMSGMFAETRFANPKVSKWNTANVTSMKGMFENAKNANPNMNNWIVSNVLDFSEMLYQHNNAPYEGHIVSVNPIDYVDISNWEMNKDAKITNFYSISTSGNAYGEITAKKVFLEKYFANENNSNTYSDYGIFNQQGELAKDIDGLALPVTVTSFKGLSDGIYSVKKKDIANQEIDVSQEGNKSVIAQFSDNRLKISGEGNLDYKKLREKVINNLPYKSDKEWLKNPPIIEIETPNNLEFKNYSDLFKSEYNGLDRKNYKKWDIIRHAIFKINGQIKVNDFYELFSYCKGQLPDISKCLSEQDSFYFKTRHTQLGKIEFPKNSSYIELIECQADSIIIPNTLDGYLKIDINSPLNLTTTVANVKNNVMFFNRGVYGVYNQNDELLANDATYDLARIDNLAQKSDVELFKDERRLKKLLQTLDENQLVTIKEYQVSQPDFVWKGQYIDLVKPFVELTQDNTTVNFYTQQNAMVNDTNIVMQRNPDKIIINVDYGEGNSENNIQYIFHKQPTIQFGVNNGYRLVEIEKLYPENQSTPLIIFGNDSNRLTAQEYYYDPDSKIFDPTYVPWCTDGDLIQGDLFGQEGIKRANPVYGIKYDVIEIKNGIANTKEVTGYVAKRADQEEAGMYIEYQFTLPIPADENTKITIDYEIDDWTACWKWNNEIEIEKKWVGTPTDSVQVKLFADGKPALDRKGKEQS
ncbi:surface protein [Granulicatella balaenopterae]|uniref:Surface protein n=1 Tax=Granulicatella balaenopterae TaxID=137733 RepID=A0A1H9NMF4_9LACT|nr:BspA family leucine-rich repeat surface protein [Granulicatella balaenopterae]SER37082.1 surface protein [Granulicatella balaenopterae]